MVPRRGCGTRVAGGVYAEVGLSPVGLPLERFLYCPPKRVPDVGLSAQGQVVRRREGSFGPETIMFDYIGAAHYPNVTDFLEEGRRYGFSFRITPDTASKLTLVSWALPVHTRAFILNWREIAPRPIDSCPFTPSQHGVGDEMTDVEMDWFASLYPESDLGYEHTMCSGYWWCDVWDADVVALDARHKLAEVRRSMPSFTYAANLLNANVGRRYEWGIIARLPINKIAVIAGGAQTEENYERVAEAQKQAGLPVEVVNE